MLTKIATVLLRFYDEDAELLQRLHKHRAARKKRISQNAQLLGLLDKALRKDGF